MPCKRPSTTRCRSCTLSELLTCRPLPAHTAQRSRLPPPRAPAPASAHLSLYLKHCRCCVWRHGRSGDPVAARAGHTQPGRGFHCCPGSCWPSLPSSLHHMWQQRTPSGSGRNASRPAASGTADAPSGPAAVLKLCTAAPQLLRCAGRQWRARGMRCLGAQLPCRTAIWGGMRALGLGPPGLDRDNSCAARKTPCHPPRCSSKLLAPSLSGASASGQLLSAFSIRGPLTPPPLLLLAAAAASANRSGPCWHFQVAQQAAATVSATALAGVAR